MEWLINRRRMMYNKAVPPAYLTFESAAFWTIACNLWGDYNQTVITDNGNNTVNIVTTFISKLGGTTKKSVVIESLSNVDNSESIYVAGTTKEPVGITAKQCAAVTQTNLGSNIKNKGDIGSMNELIYFTSITNVDAGTMGGTYPTAIQIPTGVTYFQQYNNWVKNLTILDIPATVTRVANLRGVEFTSLRTMIIRCNFVANVSYSTSFPSTAAFYVPDDLLDSYKEASGWSSIASRIYPISNYSLSE